MATEKQIHVAAFLYDNRSECEVGNMSLDEVLEFLTNRPITKYEMTQLRIALSDLRSNKQCLNK